MHGKYVSSIARPGALVDSHSPGVPVVLAGNGCPALAQRTCEALGIPLGKATVAKFPDGEICGPSWDQEPDDVHTDRILLQ